MIRAAGHSWRLACGDAAIEAALPEALDRTRARRAFVITSRSIPRATDTIRRITAALGERCAGVFDGIEKDSTYASVRAAQAAAHDAGADLLVAVGGGSVIVAVRAVAIFLAEPGDPLTLMTQYPEGRAAFSPRLTAPKLPIVNIPTTPTSAANRAGTGLANPDLDHRMEYFDPKTRPQAIILDTAALAATPHDVLRSTATTVFATTVAAMAQLGLNPLAEGDRDQAFRLAHRAYLRLIDTPADPAPRLDLALAAFLQNRAEDDGAPRFRGGPFAGNYAVSTALHVLYPHVGQGEATCVLQAAGIRIAPSIEAASARQVADALGVAPDAVADTLEAIYTRAGMPTRLRSLGIPQADLPRIAASTVKNFNANAGLRSPEAQVAEALRLLEAAY
jgi:alcohol dehydrogenase class IV